MKSFSLRLVQAAVCAVVCGGSLQAQEEPSLNWAKARDATSESSLLTAMSATRPLIDQLAGMKKPLTDVVPSTGNSLYTKSLILFDGEMHTLIPVGSVLHLPVNLRSRVISKPQGDFTFWPNFLKRNSSWLAGKEVPLKMAKGDAKLAAAVLRETSTSTRVLVSVYKQCPISVLEAPPQKVAVKP